MVQEIQKDFPAPAPICNEERVADTVCLGHWALVGLVVFAKPFQVAGLGDTQPLAAEQLPGMVILRH
eukprot:s972_g5.t1